MRPILGCLLLLAALSSAACKTLKPVTLAQLNAIRPEFAWVTQADQSVIVVSSPQVVGDTLLGYVNGVYEEMPSAQIKQLLVQRSATTKTALLVSAIAVGFGGMAYALAGGGGSDPCDPSYCEEHGEAACCV